MKYTSFPLPGFLMLIMALSGCRSTQPGREPLQFGICQPGAQWPGENNSFSSPPTAYENYLWEPYLQSPRRQVLFDEFSIVWLRQDFSWERMEPEKDDWNFDSSDWAMDAAEENGRKVMIVLAFDAPWIYEEEGKRRNITAGEREHYLNYVRTLARRDGDRAGGFEVWNEPNFKRFWTGREEDFFALTREAVRVLKEECPDVPVAVGALSYHPLSGGRAFLKKMIRAGAMEGADAVSVHPYAVSLDAAARRVAGVRTLLNNEGLDHMIWVTEMGFPTTGLYPHKVSLKNHYDQTFKALTLMTAAGADLITWYKLFDSYNPEEAGLIVNSERSFGLMSRKEEWKPGAYAFRLLAGELKDMIYTPEKLRLTGSQKSAVRAYCYTGGNGRQVITLWPRDSEKGLKFETEGLENAEYLYNPLELNRRGPVLIRGTGGGIVTLRISPEEN